MARLQEYYRETIVPQIMSEQKYKNINQVPRIEKIVLNMGVGEATRDKNQITEAVAHMTTIAGQKPIITKARRSIAGFKVREGMNIGCKVTLRGERMWEFFDRLVNVASPRIRDFRGLSDRLDGRGNYTIGVPEIIIFPEVDLDSVTHQQGMHITIVTSAETDDEARDMLTRLGMPFKRGEEQ